MQKNPNPLMDFEKVDQLLEDFNRSTGFVTAILDLEGNVLSQSGWRDICTLFHRKHPETAHNCLISDTELANNMEKCEKYHFYKCLNGLVDVATPIIISGEHVANLFTGQFFFEKPDMDFFKKQAKKYGFDEEKYFEAIDEVPVISQEKAEANLNFLGSMAHLIGELSHQKNKLKESEALFKNIFEKSSIGKSITSLTGEIKVNKAFAEMLGYSIDELQNLKWQDITPKDEIESIQKLVDPLVLGLKSTVRFEKKYICKNKSLVWADVNTTLQRDENGKPEYFITAVVDITEKKKAEQKLFQSEERLRLSTELANVAVWEFDFKTNSMSRSKNHDRLYGLDWQEKWEFETFVNAMHPEDREYSNTMIQQSVAVGGADNYKFDFRTITPEKEVRWLEVTGQVVERNENGEGIIVRGCLIDITDRKQTEIAHRLSEEKFQSAFHISPVGVTINKISDGKFLEVNDAFCEMFEYKRNEVIGYTSLELNLILREERKKLIQMQMESGGLRNYEMIFQTKSGKPLYSLFSSRPIEIEGEKCHITLIIDITEKHYASLQLAESEKRYRSLFENMNAGFVLFEVVQDKNGKNIDLIIVDANSGFEHTTGLDLRSAKGKRLTSVLPGIEKDEADWIGNYSEIAITGIPKQFENYSKLLDTYYSVSGFRAGLRLCAVTFTDITAIKKAEMALKESEARFRKLYEDSANGMVLVGKDFKFLSANQAFCQMTGYSEEELQEYTFPDITYPDDKTKDVYSIKRLIAGKIKVYRTEKRYVKKNGEIFWGQVIVSPIIDSNGVFQYNVVVVIDISEKKVAEEKLFESEEKFSILFQKTPFTAALSSASDLRFVEVNEAFEKLWGYSAEEIIGKKSSELNLYPDLDERVRLSSMFREQGFIHNIETKMSNKNGELIDVLINSDIVTIRGERFVLSTVQDISKRKQAEAEMAGQLHELERWHNVMLDREERVLELKKEVNELLRRVGEPPCYLSADSNASQDKAGEKGGVQ